ncbi:MAG: hypothetical protein HOV66_09110, partial [Streptomycetaceae bacterium]|nr:hypothetical protein [Streptomycetaceae bacterium]
VTVTSQRDADGVVRVRVSLLEGVSYELSFDGAELTYTAVHGTAGPADVDTVLAMHVSRLLAHIGASTADPLYHVGARRGVVTLTIRGDAPWRVLEGRTEAVGADGRAHRGRARQAYESSQTWGILRPAEESEPAADRPLREVTTAGSPCYVGVVDGTLVAAGDVDASIDDIAAFLTGYLRRNHELRELVGDGVAVDFRRRNHLGEFGGLGIGRLEIRGATAVVTTPPRSSPFVVGGSSVRREVALAGLLARALRVAPDDTGPGLAVAAAEIFDTKRRAGLDGGLDAHSASAMAFAALTPEERAAWAARPDGAPGVGEMTDHEGIPARWRDHANRWRVVHRMQALHDKVALGTWTAADAGEAELLASVVATLEGEPNDNADWRSPARPVLLLRFDAQAGVIGLATGDPDAADDVAFDVRVGMPAGAIPLGAGTSVVYVRPSSEHGAALVAADLADRHSTRKLYRAKPGESPRDGDDDRPVFTGPLPSGPSLDCAARTALAVAGGDPLRGGPLYAAELATALDGDWERRSRYRTFAEVVRDLKPGDMAVVSVERPDLAAGPEDPVAHAVVVANLGDGNTVWFDPAHISRDDVRRLRARKPIDLARYFYRYRAGDWEFPGANIDAILTRDGEPRRPLHGRLPTPGRGPTYPIGAHEGDETRPDPTRKLVQTEQTEQTESAASGERPPAGPSLRELFERAAQGSDIHFALTALEGRYGALDLSQVTLEHTGPDAAGVARIALHAAIDDGSGTHTSSFRQVFELAGDGVLTVRESRFYIDNPDDRAGFVAALGSALGRYHELSGVDRVVAPEPVATAAADVTTVPRLGFLLETAAAGRDSRAVTALVQGFAGRYGPFALTDIDAVVTELGGIVMECVVTDAAGNPVGMLKRTYGRGRDGKLVVDNDGMRLVRSAQRRGFATAFTAASDDYLRRSGDHRVNVFATGDGVVTWAKAGFGWDVADKDAVSNIRAAFERTKEALSAADAQRARQLLDGFDNPDPARWPSPLAVVSLRGDRADLGEAIIRGTSTAMLTKSYTAVGRVATDQGIPSSGADGDRPGPEHEHGGRIDQDMAHAARRQAIRDAVRGDYPAERLAAAADRPVTDRDRGRRLDPDGSEGGVVSNLRNDPLSAPSAPNGSFRRNETAA